MFKTSLIMLLLLLIYQPSSANSAKKSLEKGPLLLVGGGLKTCSSMSSNQCKTVEFISSEDKTEALYQLNSANITKLLSAWDTNHLPKQRAKVSALLDRMVTNRSVLTKSELRTLWKKYDLNDVINKLADAEYYLLLDALEIPQFNKDGTRRSEQVNLSATKNPFTKEIFSEFAKISAQIANDKGKKKPHILIVTASARDTFEAVDFYLQVFEQLDVSVSWLPIDAAVNKAWQKGSSEHCLKLSEYREDIHAAYFRESLYPDLAQQQVLMCQQQNKMLEAIEEADAIFINGGDQSLTRQAFRTEDGKANRLLQKIRIQFNNNKLAIGGTSAGTAVMSGDATAHTVPMLTNGRSEVALVRGAIADRLPNAGCAKNDSCEANLLMDDLSYHSSGGIGMFPFGILDTHFSERGRQGRLMQLTFDTNTHFGFGIDETTALLVEHVSEKVHFRVIGANGVFLSELSSTVNLPNRKTFMTHYFTRDDQFELHDKELVFKIAQWKQSMQIETQLPSKIDDIFVGNKYKNTLKLVCMTGQDKMQMLSIWNNSQTIITASVLDNSLQRMGLITIDDSQYNYCSYTNIKVSMDSQF